MLGLPVCMYICMCTYVHMCICTDVCVRIILKYIQRYVHMCMCGCTYQYTYVTLIYSSCVCFPIEPSLAEKCVFSNIQTEGILHQDVARCGGKRQQQQTTQNTATTITE